MFSCKKSNTIINNQSIGYLDTFTLQTSISEPLSSVFFVSGKEGYVGGYKGGLYKTNDSAKTWIALSSPVKLPIYSLFFLNPEKGFAVGGQNDCGGSGCILPGGFILRTLNGGETWTQVYTPTDKIEISSIFFTDALNGFCVGDNVIFKTTNAGQNWSEYKIDNLGGKMMEVTFVNEREGYIACLSDKFLKTEDGGLTWQSLSPHRNTGYYSVSEANGSIYLSGQGKILKSTDGGNSWTDLKNSPLDIYALHFVNNKTGFAFGRGNYSGGDFGHSYGSIYYTNDGGLNWSGTAAVKNVSLIESVSFPNNDIGYAASGNKIIRILVK